MLDSQTYQALNALNVRRRVILSGTPIQVRKLCPFYFGQNTHLHAAERLVRIFLPSEFRKPELPRIEERLPQELRERHHSRARCRRERRKQSGKREETQGTRWTCREVHYPTDERPLVQILSVLSLLRIYDACVSYHIIQCLLSTSKSCSVAFRSYNCRSIVCLYPRRRSRRCYAGRTPSHSRLSTS